MRSSTETLIDALTKLAGVLESPEGLAEGVMYEAAERLEEQQRTLRVIRTWAEFYRESPMERANTLELIRDKCDKVLDLKGK